MTQKILLIAGMAHSGTTILQRAIKCHPRVSGPIPETKLLIGKSEESIRQDIARLRKDYKGYEIIVEKTPVHLWFYEELVKVDTSSQMLVIIRDGKDVVASQKERLGRFYSIFRGASSWADTVQKALSLALKYPDNVKIVRYERFVEDFETTMSEAIKFVGLNHEDYDFGSIRRESSESFLSEEKEMPIAVDLPLNTSTAETGCRLETSNKDMYIKDKTSNGHQIDDEIDIMAYRKLQVASPLFNGEGKHRSLSNEDIHSLYRQKRFCTMMNFMGYRMPNQPADAG